MISGEHSLAREREKSVKQLALSVATPLKAMIARYTSRLGRMPEQDRFEPHAVGPVYFSPNGELSLAGGCSSSVCSKACYIWNGQVEETDNVGRFSRTAMLTH